MKLLLIEDASADLDACKTTLNRWNDEHDDASRIELVEKLSLDDALSYLHSYESASVEGIILDLNLDRRGDAGEKIIFAITEMKRRIPIYVFTATPDALSFPYVLGKKKKGECQYDEIFTAFDMVRRIGLTKILGNNGRLEDCLKKIFDYGIIPYMKYWEEYAEDAGMQESEHALARHVSLQLHDVMDGDSEKFAPNEFYVTNLDESRKFVKSGELLKSKNEGTFYVVLTPPCDLVLRGDGKKPKSKTVLLGVLEDANRKMKEVTAIISKKLKKEGANNDDIAKEISDVCCSIESNAYCLNYHYFPGAMGLQPMLLNFRVLVTRTHNEIANEYARTNLRVASSFFRDVLARFSSYYGRQGQPEVNLVRKDLV